MMHEASPRSKTIRDLLQIFTNLINLEVTTFNFENILALFDKETLKIKFDRPALVFSLCVNSRKLPFYQRFLSLKNSLKRPPPSVSNLITLPEQTEALEQALFISKMW